MMRFEAEPHALLRPYVASYRGFAREFSQRRDFSVTPDRFVVLIFFVDTPYVDDANGRIRLPTCTLVPLLEEPLRLAARLGAVRPFVAAPDGTTVTAASVAEPGYADQAHLFQHFQRYATQSPRAFRTRLSTIARLDPRRGCRIRSSHRFGGR